jgi:hypothetical protein
VTFRAPGRSPFWAFDRPSDLNTWTWKYNPNLIGQDKRNPGQQIYDLVPAQLTPDPRRDLRTWTWSYNLNLIGQDLLPFRQQDWPLPTAPRQPAYSWIDPTKIWLTPVTLTLPIGESIYDRPTLPVPPAQTWAWSYNLNLIGQDQLPFRNLDWSPPTPPYRPDYSFFNFLIGPITLPLNQQTDWPLPIRQPPLLQTWIQPVNLALTTIVARLPFNQSDWPSPRAPLYPTPSWTASYNLNLIGKDQLPVGKNITDLPSREAREIRTWISPLNLALTTVVTTGVTLRPPIRGLPDQPVALFQPFPFPNLVLTAVPAALPVGKVSTDLPPRDYQRAQDLRTWIQSVNLALTVAPTITVFRAPTYANPRGPDYSVQLRTWVQSVNLALTPAVAFPFNQSDWPIPRPAAQPALGFTAFYNPNLIGKDRLPNRQQDWPLSSAHALSQIPLQIMVAGKPFFLVPPVPLPPGAILTDRPQLRQGTSADLYTIAYSPLTEPFTPPPVSGVIPLRTLMGTGV